LMIHKNPDAAASSVAVTGPRLPAAIKAEFEEALHHALGLYTPSTYADVGRRLLGQVSIIEGGYCDRNVVKISDTDSRPCFRPWRTEQEKAASGGYTDVLLKCALQKHILVVPGGVDMRPPVELYLPYWLIQQLGFDLEGEPSFHQQPLFLFSDQMPYESQTTAALR